MHSIESSGKRPCLLSEEIPAAPALAQECAGGVPAKPSRLWLWFVAAFLIQAAAWIVWFMIASQHRIEEVPLVSGDKR